MPLPHLYSPLPSEHSLRAHPSAITSIRLHARLPISAAAITSRGVASRQSFSSLPSKQSSWPSHRHISKMQVLPQWKFPGWHASQLASSAPSEQRRWLLQRSEAG